MIIIIITMIIPIIIIILLQVSDKLTSFSQKLRSLTSPGTPLRQQTTPRSGQGMVTPRSIVGSFPVVIVEFVIPFTST